MVGSIIVMKYVTISIIISIRYIMIIMIISTI